MGLAVLIKAVRAGRVFINLFSLSARLREKGFCRRCWYTAMPARDVYTNSGAKNKKSPKWLGRLEMDA